MTKIQHVTEDGIVYVAGYQMIARNVRIEKRENWSRVVFEGHVTSDHQNDPIRGTSYDGGTYGGNHLIYTWEEN